ncbi:MAG: putative Ser/Thr protein kinase [Lysobacterales bacterium]|jgi:predicted Ser/Thr protein kinase
MFDSRIPKFIPEWAEASLAGETNILAKSNQGTILLFKEGGMEFVVKTAMGGGATRKARQATLERECAAYSKLNGVSGIPKCYGMVAGRYLVLEHVHGTPYRGTEFENRDQWFTQLLSILREIHSRGVSHGDLKSKSNLIVTERGRPCVIDFGTTFLWKEGFHPINNRMFDYLVQLDINAWVKHKYHGHYEEASEEDKKLLQYSRAEAVLRKYRKWRDS